MRCAWSSRSEGQRCCQAPPGRASPSRTTKSAPARCSAYAADRPACPAPITTTSACTSWSTRRAGHSCPPAPLRGSGSLINDCPPAPALLREDSFRSGNLIQNRGSGRDGGEEAWAQGSGAQQSAHPAGLLLRLRPGRVVAVPPLHLRVDGVGPLLP